MRSAIPPREIRPPRSRTFLDPATAYFAARDADGALVACWCFGPDAPVPGGDYAGEALEVGGGARPELTGRGLGLPPLQAELDFARERFRPPAFRVTVAAWNARALTVCGRAGFVREQTFAQSGGDALRRSPACGER